MSKSQNQCRIPRLFKESGRILKDVSEGVGSLKNLVFNGRHPNRKAIYALCATALQNLRHLDDLISKARFLQDEHFNPWVVKILLTQFFWGKNPLKGDLKLIKTILAHEQTLKDFAQDFLDVNSKGSDRGAVKPRYVRINTLKVSTEKAIQNFIEEGWNIVTLRSNATYQDFLDWVCRLNEDEFIRDYHIPDLLVFPSKTAFYDHPAYNSGHIILQDKASCLPVHILAPEPNSVVLDMCAAPGMKTSHISALLNNKGKIYAVEIDAKRYETLNEMLEYSGVTCAETLHKDVLSLFEGDCPDTEFILVDPSCTGSGIRDRIGMDEQSEADTRVEKLARLQIKMLRHALKQFPKAKRVVYSTCSLNPKENEDVVRQVLETVPNYKIVPVQKFLKSEWFNFGSAEYGDIGKCCLYCKPEVDYTNGFFVAVFEKLPEEEKNPYLVRDFYTVHAKNRHNQKKKQDAESEEKQEILNTVSKTENEDELKKVKKSKKRKLKLTDEKVEKCEEVVANMESISDDKQHVDVRLKKSKKHKKKKENKN